MNIDLEPCRYRESGTPVHWNKGPGDQYVVCRHPILRWPEIGVDEATCLQCQALSETDVYGPPRAAWRKGEGAR